MGGAAAVAVAVAGQRVQLRKGGGRDKETGPGRAGERPAE